MVAFPIAVRNAQRALNAVNVRSREPTGTNERSRRGRLPPSYQCVPFTPPLLFIRWEPYAKGLLARTTRLLAPLSLNDVVRMYRPCPICRWLSWKIE